MKPRKPILFVIAIIVLSLMAWMAIFSWIPAWAFTFYAAVSLITFTLYAIDKSAARQNKRRIPESTLHLWALIGSWPGAMIGQQILRHKTVKQPFRSVF